MEISLFSVIKLYDLRGSSGNAQGCHTQNPTTFQPEMQLILKIDWIQALNLGWTVGDFDLDSLEPPTVQQWLSITKLWQNPPVGYRVTPDSRTLTWRALQKDVILVGSWTSGVATVDYWSGSSYKSFWGFLRGISRPSWHDSDLSAWYVG